MIPFESIQSSSWVISPAAWAVSQPAPADVRHQRWHLTLTGVGIANLKGVSAANWRFETLKIWPEIATAAVNSAIARYSIPRPPPPPDGVVVAAFQVDHWAPFAALNGIFDENQAINAGFEVRGWRAESFRTEKDALSGQDVSNLFNGIQVDVAVRDSDGWLLRVGYHITLLGRIRFVIQAPMM
jgi:hypothetical protein